MTRIHGQIEPLKRIRETLDREGITRFSSIGDINSFLKNYENEKEELLFNIEHTFENELELLQTKSLHLQRAYEDLKSKTESGLNTKIYRLKTKCENLSHPAKNAVLDILNWYQQQVLLAYKFILEKSYKGIVHRQTRDARTLLVSVREKVNTYTSKRQTIISERCGPKFRNLEQLKSICSELKPLIAGAIGENLVAKELEKLSDDCVLLNDFSLKFVKPIYNKNENDLIRSIQIDHLVITHAGIFIIETKNWSKTSLERYDLRSPVKQIQRVSYALFVLFNSKKRNTNRLLKKHHWGNKKLPIRNIVVMINHKPHDKFNYVAIKTLNELNGYINYFDPLFDSTEVQNIADHLIQINGQHYTGI